jgi:hypothetical protein
MLVQHAQIERGISAFEFIGSMLGMKHYYLGGW